MFFTFTASKNKIDTSTFTRPKKKQLTKQNKNYIGNNDNTSPHDKPETTDASHCNNITSHNTPERNNNQNGSLGSGEVDENANGHLGTSGGSQENLGTTTHRLNDVTDVQVLAKMQEDSEYPVKWLSG